METQPMAPEWRTIEWFNTSEPLTLAALRGRVVMVCAFQMLCRCCHVKFLWLERSAARGYSGDTGRNPPCIESFEPMVANCLRGAATGRN
ncbi:hypothetical protein BA011_36865 (plasmid) [Rhizobium leguminosarum]|uniref:Uncharacterized protein n=1 Tax=Rhizobium leguminosarum TaxID=384 RepID=A0A1B1CPF4_RHILE|nr:hypothetical protein BA011_36865 [Rhizobium leguminosarum]